MIMKKLPLENPLEQIKSISGASLPDQLAEKIRYLIVNNDIAQGYVFPNENDFCAFLKVGRGTLREAYKILEWQGFISRSRRGTVVNDWNDIAEKLPLAVALEISDIQDLLEFRCMVEEQTAELAATRRTDEDIVKMGMSMDNMQKNADNASKLAFYDTVFHLELAHASGNRLLDTVTNAITTSYAASFFKLFDTHEDLRGRAIEYHRRIYNAVTNRDSTEARKAMREHIGDVVRYSQSTFALQERIAHMFGKRPGWNGATIE